MTINRKEFLERIGSEARPYFDKLFTQTGERFRIFREGDQGYRFRNEEKCRTLQTPDGQALVTFCLDRSVSIDRLGLKVKLNSKEKLDMFLEVYPNILDALVKVAIKAGGPALS